MLRTANIKGDDHIYKEFQNRDYRLRLFSASELDRLQMKQEPVESDPTTWNVPKILELPEGRNVTGYHIRKAMSYKNSSGEAVVILTSCLITAVLYSVV